MQINYKKNLKSMLLLVFVGFVGLSTLLTSCDKDDDAKINEVTLFSYGPMPIARGAELRFIGEKLDEVKSIIIPPGLEIASSEFTEHSPISIKLTVPQEAVEGYLDLLSANITLTTKTPIGFLEPISIESISPETIKAGSVFTIDGDYLNLVGEVIFTDRVSIDSSMFVTQSRKQITLVVPKEAQTGKIAVSNAAEDPIVIYSSDELSVVIPMLISLAPEQIKAGEDIIISGEDLDLIASINFQEGTSIDAADFKSQDSSEIVVTAPDNIQDGTITLVTFSGLEMLSEQSLTAVLPTNVIVEAVSRFKSGLEVLISGTDIDLVTSLMFAGATEATDFTFADNKITVVIPANAVNGVVTLNTASGKSMETEMISLVEPIVSGVAPNPVTSGGDIVITGTDLDLITSATFTGDETVDITANSETSITLAVPIKATTGEVSLFLANGMFVNTPSLTVINPIFCFIPVLPADDAEILPSKLFSFNIENGNVLTEVIIGGNATQFIIDGNILHVMIPANSGGDTDLTLVSSNGEVTYSINVMVSEKVIWDEGPKAVTWGQDVAVSDSGFDGVSAGSVLKIYFTQTPNWGQCYIENGSWSIMKDLFPELSSGIMKSWEVGDNSVSEIELTLTQEVLDNIRNSASGGVGMMFRGQDWIIDKVIIIN